MELYNQSKTIEEIERYIESMGKETSSQPYKPFFTLYAKQRHWLNPFKYILGEYKFRWFEKDKQPRKYKNAFELYIETLDLGIKDIRLINFPS